jgi:hypothetical protein
LDECKAVLLIINQAPPHEDVWGSEDITAKFFTSALDGCEWSASGLGSSISGEISPGTHWISWVIKENVLAERVAGILLPIWKFAG